MLPLLGPRFRNQTLRKRNRRRTAVQYGRRPTFENLERRTMLAATLINTPSWAEKGPGVGAVEAIAVDPSNANHVFIGTVNGGIWQTTNISATTPNWTTTTDQLPSLAIGAIAINPANTNHIY